MKKALRMILSAAVIFAAVMAGFNIVFSMIYRRQLSDRNITANRINSIISSTCAESGDPPEAVISGGLDRWRDMFGDKAPDSIHFIPISEDSTSLFYATAEERYTICSLYGADGRLAGLIEYRFSDNTAHMLRLCANAVLTGAFVIVMLFISGTYIKIVLPFRRLSEYPEKLARLRDIQKLPESRSRFFGKYVWGMNMLTDVLAANSRRIHELEGEHQKLVTSIAHGVKTPVANIRLYTDAVRTGLYTEEGACTVIADKIDKSTEKIQALAEELMSAADASSDGYGIELSRFSLSELAELIRSEYTDRMKLLRIPFTVECHGAPVLESDKYALYRAVNQLLENALKYGDGRGIKVELMKQDDSFSISVRSKGELLPASELPYVFRSYWRGSNAADKSGSGIGLYVVHETSRALGGSVHARRIEETSEMEFVIYLEK